MAGAKAKAAPTSGVKWPADAIERRKVSALIPYARNARTHSDAQVAQIAASIREWGWTNPVLIDAEGGLIAGHGRVLAARKLGIEDIPCMIATGWSEAQKRAYILADNQLALNAGWDIEMLKVEVGELGIEGFDLGLIGFGDDFLAGLMNTGTEGLTDPDDVPEPPAEPVTVLGDVYVLGKHRLVCGDSTNANTVAKALDGSKAAVLITDPPYGIGYKYKDHDDSSSEDNAQLCKDVFALAPQSKVYTPGLMNLRRELNRYPTAKVAVWHKKFAAAGNGMGGASTWEPIIIESPLASSLKNDVLQIMTDRVQVGGKSLRDLHSCPKPVALYQELVKSFSRPGDIVYEPFCGSGTTLIACEMEGRACHGLELSPAYCDVIVKRWEDFTGQKATRITAEETEHAC